MNFIERNMLKIFWFVSLIVTIGVLNKFAPNWPVPPFVPYSLTAVGLALGTYLVSILGNLSYLTAKNKGLDTMLDQTGQMEKFIEALTEPWGHLVLISTAAMYIATYLYPAYNALIGAMEFISISTMATSAFSIMRNLHLIKLFTTATMRQSVLHENMKAAFFHDLFTHMQQQEEEQSIKDTDTVN